MKTKHHPCFLTMTVYDDAGARRWAQLVFADSSALKAPDANCGVEMTLFIPKRAAAGPMKTLGGFMSLPLRAVRMGAGSSRYDTSNFLDPRANGQGVTVVLDTGSQGFWIIDTTRGKDGLGLLASLPGGYGNGSGAYELELGDPGGPTFTITIPEQWRDFAGAPSLVTQPADPAPNTDCQTIILGNPWLQAIAVTFDVHRMRGILSHLDKDGNRVPAYAGPKSTVSPPLARGISSYRLNEPRPSPFRDGDYLGPELQLTSLAKSAPPAATTPKGSDVTLDLRLMFFPAPSKLRSVGGGALIAREVQGTTELILPTLDSDVQLADGRTARISKIVDTGSGINLLLDTDFAAEQLDGSNGATYCNTPGTVANVFDRAAALSGVQSTRCGTCPTPERGAHQSGGFCNDFCCVVEGMNCNTVLPCSVGFCTGVVAYSPGITKLALPSENGTDLLRNFSSFAGNATAACIPGPTVGIWGFWFWDSAPKGDEPSGANVQATALPYYVLAELGQIGQPLENYTLKFWRSDLSTGQKGLPVGRAPLAKIPGPTRPVWDGPSPAALPSPTPAAQPAPAPAATRTPAPAATLAPAEPLASPTPAASLYPPDGAPSAIASGEPAPTRFDLGAGSAYSRNGDRGVQQVVVIEAAARPGSDGDGRSVASVRSEQCEPPQSQAQSSLLLNAPKPGDPWLRPLLIAAVSLLGVGLAFLVLWLLLRRDDGAVWLTGEDLLAS